MRLAALVALLLALSGCVSPPDETVEPLTAEPTAAPPSASPPPASPPAPSTPASETSTAAPSAADAPPASPRVEVTWWNGTYSGVGASPPAGPVCCWWRSADEGHWETFEVPVGLRGAIVELAWDDPTFDLDLAVHGADWGAFPDPEKGRLHQGHQWHATAGGTGDPDGLARIELADAEALALVGTWSWRVGAEVAHEVPYRVAVSLFFDAPPPAGHSAFTSSSGNP